MEIPEILDAIHLALDRHGIAAIRNAQDVSVPEHGLRFAASVADTQQIGDLLQVVLTIHIHSDLLSANPIYECFAGWGDSRHQAVVGAFDKFLDGALHPIVDALAGYVCDQPRVDIQHWHRASTAWKVFCGPLLCNANGEVTLPDVYWEFFDQLKDLFTATVSPGAHFVRVFFGGCNSVSQEVLLNSAPWQQGAELLSRHRFPALEYYQSVRHVIIALPETLTESLRPAPQVSCARVQLVIGAQSRGLVPRSAIGLHGRAAAKEAETLPRSAQSRTKPAKARHMHPTSDPRSLLPTRRALRAQQ